MKQTRTITPFSLPAEPPRPPPPTNAPLPPPSPLPSSEEIVFLIATAALIGKVNKTDDAVSVRVDWPPPLARANVMARGQGRCVHRAGLFPRAGPWYDPLPAVVKGNSKGECGLLHAPEGHAVQERAKRCTLSPPARVYSTKPPPPPRPTTTSTFFHDVATNLIYAHLAKDVSKNQQETRFAASHSVFQTFHCVPAPCLQKPRLSHCTQILV